MCLHDRLALEMTDSKVAGQAAEAFTALLGSTEAAGKPVDDQIVSVGFKNGLPAEKDRSCCSRQSIQTIWNGLRKFFS